MTHDPRILKGHRHAVGIADAVARAIGPVPPLRPNRAKRRAEARLGIAPLHVVYKPRRNGDE